MVLKASSSSLIYNSFVPFLKYFGDFLVNSSRGVSAYFSINCVIIK